MTQPSWSREIIIVILSRKAAIEDCISTWCSVKEPCSFTDLGECRLRIPTSWLEVFELYWAGGYPGKLSEATSHNDGEQCSECEAHHLSPDCFDLIWSHLRLGRGLLIKNLSASTRIWGFLIDAKRSYKWKEVIVNALRIYGCLTFFGNAV